MNQGRSGVSLKDAAASLKIDVSTLRRDIQNGCPVVELGSVGRGKGSLVNVDAVRRWRAIQHGDVLPLVEAALMQVLQDGLHDRLNISQGKLGYILIRTYERVHENVTKSPLIELPEQMRRLCTICLESIECGDFHQEGLDGFFQSAGR